jgi:hypothetical protein
VTAEPAPVAASPVMPFDASERVRPSSATTIPRVVDRSVITPAPARDVTLPIGLAAGLLVLVVGGLAWQVATDRVRVVSGKRASSVVDVWELALAA